MSAAARRVKVRSKMRSGLIPLTIKWAARAAIVVVFSGSGPSNYEQRTDVFCITGFDAVSNRLELFGI